MDGRGAIRRGVARQCWFGRAWSGKVRSGLVRCGNAGSVRWVPVSHGMAWLVLLG
jgi:hypothetical protein